MVLKAADISDVDDNKPTVIIIIWPHKMAIPEAA
jgi:hypothetical protein